MAALSAGATFEEATTAVGEVAQSMAKPDALDSPEDSGTERSDVGEDHKPDPETCSQTGETGEVEIHESTEEHIDSNEIGTEVVTKAEEEQASSVSGKSDVTEVCMPASMEEFAYPEMPYTKYFYTQAEAMAAADVRCPLDGRVLQDAQVTSPMMSTLVSFAQEALESQILCELGCGCKFQTQAAYDRHRVVCTERPIHKRPVPVSEPEPEIPVHQPVKWKSPEVLPERRYLKKDEGMNLGKFDNSLLYNSNVSTLISVGTTSTAAHASPETDTAGAQ